MTAAAPYQPAPSQAAPPRAASQRSHGDLIRLHLASRRVPAAVILLAACVAGLRLALLHHWDTYGALQLPLVFETGCATVIAATTTSPFGEPERATGRWLPYLRLGTLAGLAAAAIGVLAAASAGTHLAGGILGVARNEAGLTGIGLLCAVLLGGGLAWAGPVAYLLAGTYALYRDWHPLALATPWLWPGRPPHDVGGTLCAGLVFVAGLAAITVRGARD